MSEEHPSSTQQEQTIPVNLKPGAWICIMEDIDMDESSEYLEGFTSKAVFEGKVKRFVPETRLLEFENSDKGYAEVMELLDEYDSVQIITA